MRFSNRILALIGLTSAFALAPTVAEAAAPANQLPNAAALARLGFTVTWPVSKASTTLPAGTLLVVRVKASDPRRARRHVVTLRLDEVAAGDFGPRLVATGRLRHGRVLMRLPSLLGARYTLTLRAGGRTYRSAIAVPGAHGTPAPPVGVPPVPASPLPPGSPCASPSFPTVLTLDRATAAPGDVLTYTISGPAGACLYAGVGYALQELVDGVWTGVVADPPIAFPAIELVVPPGQPYVGRALVYPNLTPGHYRLLADGLTAEFDVVAPPAAVAPPAS